MPPLAVPFPPARAYLLAAFIGFGLPPLPAHAWSDPASADVQLRSLAVDRSGNPLVGGTRLRGDASTVYAAKYRSDGMLLWSTDGASASQITGDVMEAVVDGTGELYVAGTEALDGERSAPFVARYSGVDGHLVWHAVVAPMGLSEGVTEGAGETLSLGSKGQLVVGGSVRTATRALGLVCRLSTADGTVQWCWTGENLVVRDTAVDRAGDVVATGTFFLAVKLAGEDGAERWRATTPGAEAQALGYPQMRTLALDRSGNVTVGGSLRETLDDTRAFYAGTLSAQTGRLLWENAGAPLHSFEAPARLVAFGGDVLAAGRQNGSPVVLGLQARTGKVRWRRPLWSGEEFADRATGVADLATDGKCGYALGTDFPGELLLNAFAAGGKSRWQRDLGPGQGVAVMAGIKKRLFAIARRPGIDGLDWHFEVLGLDATSGRDL